MKKTSLTLIYVALLSISTLSLAESNSLCAKLYQAESEEQIDEDAEALRQQVVEMQNEILTLRAQLENSTDPEVSDEIKKKIDALEKKLMHISGDRRLNMYDKSKSKMRDQSNETDQEFVTQEPPMDNSTSDPAEPLRPENSSPPFKTSNPVSEPFETSDPAETNPGAGPYRDPTDGRDFKTSDPTQ